MFMIKMAWRPINSCWSSCFWLWECFCIINIINSLPHTSPPPTHALCCRLRWSYIVQIFSVFSPSTDMKSSVHQPSAIYSVVRSSFVFSKSNMPVPHIYNKVNCKVLGLSLQSLHEEAVNHWFPCSYSRIVTTPTLWQPQHCDNPNTVTAPTRTQQEFVCWDLFFPLFPHYI